MGLGALLLIFGFLGFNAASQLSLSKPGDGIVITYATLNTLLGASGGALTALFLNRFLPFWGNYWSYLTMMNGSVAGMAAICAGCDSLPSWAAVLSGILGGIAFIVGRAILEKLEGNLRFNERFLTHFFVVEFIKLIDGNFKQWMILSMGSLFIFAVDWPVCFLLRSLSEKVFCSRAMRSQQW